MTHPEPEVIETLLAEAARHGFEQSCAPETGALLRVLAAAKPKGRLLNVGTGFGVSCAWLLDGMSEHAELWTVDIDETGSAVAKAHLDRRLHVVVEDAATFLEGAGTLGQQFDLIFADAMPGKYEHRDLALDLVARGGFYVVDDLSRPPAGRKALCSPKGWSTRSRPTRASSASASTGRPDIWSRCDPAGTPPASKAGRKRPPAYHLDQTSRPSQPNRDFGCISISAAATAFFCRLSRWTRSRNSSSSSPSSA